MPPHEALDRALIDDPMKWPLLILPMRNSSDKDTTGLPRLGYLATGMMWPDEKRVMFLGTIYDKPSDCEKVVFENTDALLEAGWRVD